MVDRRQTIGREVEKMAVFARLKPAVLTAPRETERYFYHPCHRPEPVSEDYTGVAPYNRDFFSEGALPSTAIVPITH